MNTIIWIYHFVSLADVTVTNHTGYISMFEVKALSTSFGLTPTDQIVVVSVPFIQLLAWMTAIILGWINVSQVSYLCESFCKRGFRIESQPEARVILEFLLNYFIFGVGQTIANCHVAMVYCSNAQKQILFVVLVINEHTPFG